MGKSKGLNGKIDKGQIVMARQLGKCISKTAALVGVIGLQRSVSI